MKASARSAGSDDLDLDRIADDLDTLEGEGEPNDMDAGRQEGPGVLGQDHRHIRDLDIWAEGPDFAVRGR